VGLDAELSYYNPPDDEKDKWNFARATIGGHADYAFLKQQSNRIPISMILGVGQYFNKFDFISELNFGISKYSAFTEDIALAYLVNYSAYYYAHQYTSFIAVPRVAADISVGLNLLLKNLYASAEIHYFKPEYEMGDFFSERIYFKLGLGFCFMTE